MFKFIGISISRTFLAITQPKCFVNQSPFIAIIRLQKWMLLGNWFTLHCYRSVLATERKTQSIVVSFKCMAEEWISVTLEQWHHNFCLTSCRVSQKQRPRPPEVLLPAHQDPDIHPLHWGVHLRQRQRHRPCLLWRLRWEGDYPPSVRPVSDIHMVPHTGVMLFCFSSSTWRFLPWTSLCFMLFHWQSNIRPLGKQGSQNFLWFILFPLLSFLLLQLFPSDKITDKGTKVTTYTVIRFPCTFFLTFVTNTNR